VRPRLLAAALTLATLTAAQGAAADPATDRSDLSTVQRQLEAVRDELADARGDAAKLAAALRAADEALAAAERDRLAAEARWVEARRQSVAAAQALGQATTEVWRSEASRNTHARRTYMTGGALADLNALIQARTLGDFSARMLALDRVAKENNQTLAQLRMAEVRAADARDRLAAVEQVARERRGEVERRVEQVAEVRAVHAAAKRKLDAEVARFAAREASLSGRSRALLASIRAQEAEARRRAAEAARLAAEQRQQAEAVGSARAGQVRLTGGGTCDLSGTSDAERWIIMRESGGRPTADNPTSTAYGLGQLILANRIRHLGDDYATTDCGKQLAAFRAYVADAYGNAEAAMAFWQANGWY
jgi:septal ring factor EnvC (AmiA/AmiB activator)